MKSLLLALSLISLVACEAPTRTRTGVFSNPSSSTGDGSTSGSNSGNNPWTGGTTSSGSGTGSTNTGNNLPAGFENCDISQKYYAAGINYIGVCQSKNNETHLVANPSVTNSQVRTCFIPTYKTSNGSSTYLGQPQCFYPVANQIQTDGRLVKSRAGFMGNPITGTMIMLETSVTAYFTCMNAYANYQSPQCPYGPQTNSSCSQMASQYMNQVCSDFKTRHSYIDLCLNTSYCSNQ